MEVGKRIAGFDIRTAVAAEPATYVRHGSVPLDGWPGFAIGCTRPTTANLAVAENPVDLPTAPVAAVVAQTSDVADDWTC